MTATRADRRRRTLIAIVVVIGIFAYAALLVLSRGYPTTSSDAGVFLTVDGEILRGARLYADVNDNKDPVFFYAQALALLVGGWQGPFALDIIWLGIAGCSMALLVLRLAGRRVVALAAAAVYMTLLTGIEFNAGYSGLPGLALLPLVAFWGFSAMPLWAGVGVTALALTKANLVAVALAVLVPAAYENRADLRRWSLRLTAGVAASACTVGVVFAMTGQLGPYISQVRMNASYSSVGLRAAHGAERPFGHLTVAWGHAPAELKLGVAVVAVTAVGLATSTHWSPSLRRLGWLTVAASVGTLVTVGLTHIWPHHIQLTAFALACLSAFFLAAVAAAVHHHAASSRAAAAATVVACLAMVVGALDLQRPSEDTLRAWRLPPVTTVSDALVTAAGPTALSRPHTWFHFGSNQETGVGAFLPGNWALACRQFHQYPWHPQALLRSTRHCVEERRPRFIAVTERFDAEHPTVSFYARDPSWSRPWRDFYAWGLAYIDGNCELRSEGVGVRVFECAPAPRDDIT